MSNVPGQSQPTAGWYVHPQEPGRERWWDGNGWTEHSRVTNAVAPGTPAQATQRPGTLACPTCGSQDAKTLKIINAQGTSKGSARTTGYLQNGGVASFSTSTSSSTSAARAAAAPRKKYNGIALIVIGLVVGVVLAWIGGQVGLSVFGSVRSSMLMALIIGVVIVIIGVVVALRDTGYNREVFPDALARWERSWQCQRCGSVFVV